MKESINVSLSSEGNPKYGHYLPQNAIDAIAERFPDCRVNASAIHFVRDRLSTDALEFFDLIQREAGLVPRKHRLPFEGMNDRNEFNWEGKREFAKNEHMDSKFAAITPRREFCICTSYDECGYAVISRNEIKKTLIGFGRQLECFITDALKQDMEKEGFDGLCFRPVVVRGRMPVKEVEPIWQLWADVEVPPMENAKTDMDGVSHDIDYDGLRGYYLNDLFHPYVFRYKASEMTQIADFDCVRTIEHFGCSDLRSNRVPRILCSRRFREWCIQKHLRVDWGAVVEE